ncbi:hypothetical protein CJP74_00255 [Psittacicella melopsittaci]|uniref:Uncharacterized protein n=1 Tax=Psittacicella melopsittaci TaxID=2028576 RepID=A0A3A1Y9P3_9GAMM|nr:hypothetical protein [Psittacicella melopsittaci]RIY34046.1 hypothetical protein CJP74_00255 [Psittacicella melopsittaci]
MQKKLVKILSPVALLVAFVLIFYFKGTNSFSAEQLKQFNREMTQHDLYLRQLDTSLQNSNVTLRNPDPQRYIYKSNVAELYQQVFTTLNANQAPVVEGDTLLFPGYTGFKFLFDTCTQAKPHVDLLKELAATYPEASYLCDLVLAVDRVFLTGLTPEQVFSLNVQAGKNLLPSSELEKAQNGGYGYSYTLPSLEDYLKLPVFKKYVIQ